MYLGEYYFQFPLFIVSGPLFPVVADYVPVFTEALHAQRYCQGNRVYRIENLDDLEHVADQFEKDAIGICFDPMDDNGLKRAQRPVEWKLLRMAIELERVDPDGYAEA